MPLWKQGEDFLRDLIAIEPVVVLNAAFCERHMKHCPKSEQLEQECAKVGTRLFLVCNQDIGKTMLCMLLLFQPRH